MSTPITAAYLDPQIADIRASVNLKTDAIPFLLMPVRIETRFMQVTTTTSSTQTQGPVTSFASASMAGAPRAGSDEVTPSTTEDVMEAIGNLNLLAVNAHSKLNGVTLRAVTSEAARIADSINTLGKISIKEKGWLKQLFNSLSEDVQKVNKAAGGAYVNDAKNLSAAADALRKAIHSTPHEKVRTLPHVTKMIGSLTTIDTELKTLTDKREKIPFLNVKNKKDLYIYITKVLDRAKKFYDDADSKSEGFSLVAKNQGGRMGDLHKSVQARLAQVKASIENLHSDKNWKKFVEENVGGKLSELQTSGQSFTGRTLPKISSRPQPNDLQTGDVLLHGVQTLVKIKRFNAKYENATADEVAKKFKEEVQPRIDKLSHFLKRPIKGANEKRITSIQRVFSSVGGEVNSIGGRAKKPTGNDKPGKLPNKNTTTTTTKSTTTADSSSAIKAPLATDDSLNVLSRGSLDALNIFSGTDIITDTQPIYEKTVTQTLYQLWVRIYPDDVFIKTHEEYLTIKEYDTGKQFWKTWYCASNDYDLEIAAWRTLCTALGTKRASWVSRSLDPRPLAVNAQLLQSKPSQNMTDSINLMTTVNGELKKINTAAQPADLFLALQNGNVLQPQVGNLVLALSELNTLTTVQTFLWEKHRVLLIQAASVISILNEKVQGLTPAQTTQFGPTIGALNNVSYYFNAVQSRAAQIVAKDDKQFVVDFNDTLTYQSPQVKPKEWNYAPTSNCLPDRFVVITVQDGVFKHVKVGNSIPQDLQLGLDPAKFQNSSLYGLDANGNLIMDGGLKWMFDYKEAFDRGMAVTLDLTEDLYNRGFEKLIVVGVKNTDASTSKLKLEQLLQNHIYSSDGMSFLKTGTPTNNTADKKAGYAIDDDVDERFNIEIRGWRYDAYQPNAFNKSDGKLFSDALGINHNVAQYANGAGNFEIANALAMNRSLWSGTMGHYLEEMWDSVFPYDTIRRTEKFFTNYVTGRGILPAVRIGMQPYGILTTTAFSQLKLYNDLPALTKPMMQGVNPWDTPPAALETVLQTRFEMRLHQLLKMLYNVWKGLSGQVIHSGNLYSGGDAQQRFIGMLGLHATSLDYFYRYSLNVAKGAVVSSGANANFSPFDPAGPGGLFDFFKDLMMQGIYSPSFYFYDEEPSARAEVPVWKNIDRGYTRIKEQIEGARLFDARQLDDSFPVLGNLVDFLPPSEGLLSNIPNQNINYIDWLLNSTANNILGGNDINNPALIPTNNQLFLMLRQGLLQAYQEAALNMLQKENMMTELVRRSSGNEDHYFYRLPAPGGFKNYYLTKWHYMFKNLGDLIDMRALDITMNQTAFYAYINPSLKSIANYLDRARDANPSVFNAGHQQFFDKLKKVREAVGTLKRASTASLEVLMAEHVDITSYRLDAWMLGLAHQRLLKQRTTQPAGIFIGAYGYVENLQRDKNKVTTTAANPADYKISATKPVYKDPDNDGLIHAPSQSQAIAAAVLRNAYKTNTDVNDVANRLSVNLSSARVRMALQLIEGIRNGQEVGALLGFQFERGLHERYKTIELDKYIQPFRKAFPLQQNIDAAANGAPGYVSLVVNGQAILDLVHNGIGWLTGNSGQPGIKTVADILKYNAYQYLPSPIKATIDGALGTDNKSIVYNAIIEEIDRMADAFDAMGDLAVSESVYQIVQGNHVRAAAVLNALAEGKNIPDPQIIETPRNGTIVTQRVLLNVPTVTSATTPAGWFLKSSIRYLTEPSLNNWLGTSIGDPAKWKYVLKMYNDQGQVTTQAFGNLNVMQWQPIDYFEFPGGEEELREMFINDYRRTLNDYTTKMTIDFNERHPAWAADDKTIPEALLLFKKIRNMLGNARPAGQSDLKIAGDAISSSNPGNFNVVELEARVNIGLQALGAFITTVQGLNAVYQVLNGNKAVSEVVVSPTDTYQIYGQLDRAAHLGIPNALSVNVMSAGTAEKRGTVLLQHLLNILNQAKARYQVAIDISNKIPAITVPKVRVEKLIELSKAVFGKSFIVIPTYGVPGTEAITSQLAIPYETGITRQGGTVAAEEWMQNISKVRKRIYDAQMYMQMADVYDAPIPVVKPVQLPYAANDYWLGIEYPSNIVPAGDKLSLVLINPGVFSVQGASAFSSLLIDEWLEIIPTKEVSSGIVFNYNQPNAAAPQSMLLAVTPNVTNRWEWDDLVYTVIDTMEMAKIRAVEPDHIETSIFSHIIPAVVSEIAPPPLRNQDHNPLGVQVVMDFADVKPKATT